MYHNIAWIPADGLVTVVHAELINLGLLLVSVSVQIEATFKSCEPVNQLVKQ
ncbi:hypothetical protein MAR_024606 [Mya arenaria]|uniref:Uncharacterized protein n=1 Tax=Mya arenaria TaxID=6604 RepID=A0ABY7DT32_MYAAR|nr:hypothetical protein MAR_024606 [Mya arenaria]